MHITGVRIFDPEPGHNECLLAYASMELSRMLVVKDLKIIQAKDGRVFVDFPSMLTPVRCSNCDKKTDYTARYCPRCGLPMPEAPTSGDGQPIEPGHHNLVHPINDRGRQVVHNSVMTEYRRYKSAQQERGDQWE